MVSRSLSSGKANDRNDLDTVSNRNSPHVSVPHPEDQSYKIIISNARHQTRTQSGLAIVDLNSTQHPIDLEPTSLFSRSISPKEASNPNPAPQSNPISHSELTQRSSSRPSRSSADPEDLFFARPRSSIPNSSQDKSRIQSLKRGNVNIPLDDYNI